MEAPNLPGGPPRNLRRIVHNWIGERRYLLLLVSIAFAILTVGIWLKPERRQLEAVLSETERLRLQMMTQKRSLQALTSYFTQLASNVGAHIIWIQSAGQSGLVWDATGLVVTANPPDRSVGWMEGGGRPPAEQPRIVPGIPLATVKVVPTAAIAPVRETLGGRLAAGAWILQVARGADGSLAFSQGVYSGAVPATCSDFRYKQVETSVPLGHGMLGGGLFDLEGSLVAVVLACREQVVAVAAEGVREMLGQAASAEAHLLEYAGLRVTAVAPEMSTYFGAKGDALVTEV
jgi:hypothetical protein